jgi:hypothetical protein
MSSLAVVRARVSRSIAACKIVPSGGGVQTAAVPPTSIDPPVFRDPPAFLGGEKGIRTPGTLTGTPDFESAQAQDWRHLPPNEYRSSHRLRKLLARPVHPTVASLLEQRDPPLAVGTNAYPSE